MSTSAVLSQASQEQLQTFCCVQMYQGEPALSPLSPRRPFMQETAPLSPMRQQYMAVEQQVWLHFHQVACTWPVLSAAELCVPC